MTPSLAMSVRLSIGLKSDRLLPYEFAVAVAPDQPNKLVIGYMPAMPVTFSGLFIAQLNPIRPPRLLVSMDNWSEKPRVFTMSL